MNTHARQNVSDLFDGNQGGGGGGVYGPDRAEPSSLAVAHYYRDDSPCS